LCETWLRSIENNSGVFGIRLKNDETEVFRFLLAPDLKQAKAVWFENGVERTETFALGEDFDFQAFHLLRVDVDYLSLKISLDENAIRFKKVLETAATRISLFSEKSASAFSGFTLTEGFEDLFENASLEQRGWQLISNGGEYKIENQNLVISSRNGNKTILGKDSSPNDFELTVNICILETFGENAGFGFSTSFDETAQTSIFTIERSDNNWVLKTRADDETKVLALPESFSPEVFHQFRFLKIGDKIVLQLEMTTIGIINVLTNDSGKIALSAQNASIAFDMVRLTSL
jgi:hypothetical protein